MKVYVVENVTHGNCAYSNLNEGYGKVLRYGAYSDEVLAKLRWMNDVHGAGAGRGAGAERATASTSAPCWPSRCTWATKGHNRNKAGSMLFTAKLAP